MRQNESGYFLEDDGEYTHRRVYRENFGPIPSGYDVHHVDFKTNNNPYNLIAIPREFHKWFHENFKKLQHIENSIHGTYCEKSDDLKHGFILNFEKEGVEKYLEIWKQNYTPPKPTGTRKTILRRAK